MTMAKPNDTSKARPSRNPAAAKARSASSPPKPAKAVPNLETLDDIVEEERLRLMKAHSILSCVITAMEDEDICTGDGPYWPAVIESARDLVDESIKRLEGLDYSAKPASRKNYEVREPASGFGYGVAIGSTSLSTRDGDDAYEYGAVGSSPLAYGHTEESADIAAALEPLPKAPMLN
jgi:hypothetical protein